MQRVFVSVYIGAVSDAQIGKGGGEFIGAKL